MCAIKDSQIVFGYMETTNPSGVGMACELGYAYALGKTVILVLEKDNQHQKDRYLRWMEKVAHVTFENFNEGVAYLHKFQKMHR